MKGRSVRPFSFLHLLETVVRRSMSACEAALFQGLHAHFSFLRDAREFFGLFLVEGNDEMTRTRDALVVFHRLTVEMLGDEDFIGLFVLVRT